MMVGGEQRLFFSLMDHFCASYPRTVPLVETIWSKSSFVQARACFGSVKNFDPDQSIITIVESDPTSGANKREKFGFEGRITIS